MTSNNDVNEADLLAELTPGKGTDPVKPADNAAAAAAGAAVVPEEKATFKLPDGRMVTPTQAQKEWEEHFMPDYTHKSQELAELKKTQPKKESDKVPGADGNDEEPIDQPTFKEFQRYLKRANVPTRDDLAAMIPTAARTTMAQLHLQEALKDLETDFDGSKDETLGIQKPKVTSEEVFSYIRDQVKQGAKVTLSPLQVARILHPDEFATYDAAVLARKNKPADDKPVLPVTERGGSAGGGNANPPAPKYDFGNDSIEKGLTAFLKTA